MSIDEYLQTVHKGNVKGFEAFFKTTFAEVITDILTNILYFKTCSLISEMMTAKNMVTFQNKIDDIFSKNDDGTLYHGLYTNIANDSSSLNFLNKAIWWLQISIYVLSPNVNHHSRHFSNLYLPYIFLQKKDYLRSIIVNLPYWTMINGTIQWLTKHIFPINLITRKCFVSH